MNSNLGNQSRKKVGSIHRQSPIFLLLTRNWQAVVTPVLKYGNKEELNNYRPVSCFPAASKLLERIVCKQVTIFAKTFQIYFHYSINPYSFLIHKSVFLLKRNKYSFIHSFIQNKQFIQQFRFMKTVFFIIVKYCLGISQA